MTIESLKQASFAAGYAMALEDDETAPVEQAPTARQADVPALADERRTPAPTVVRPTQNVSWDAALAWLGGLSWRPTT